MESKPISQSNPQVDSAYHSLVFHQRSIHCVPHDHWVYPPFVHGPPIPSRPCCPNSFKTCASSPVAQDFANAEQNREVVCPKQTVQQTNPKSNGSFPLADKVPGGSSAQSNGSNRLSANQEMHGKTNTTIPRQSPAAQFRCSCVPRHPHVHYHAPTCPHHHFLPCRVHGCWELPPSLFSMTPHFHPKPLCPMYAFSSMLPSCPANSGYYGPDSNRVETLSGNAAGEPTSSHIGNEYENWHLQDTQYGVMEDGYEEQEGEEEEPIFVLTDEWMEFFAKSEARRQQKKRQQQKEAKKLRKNERSASKTNDNEVEIEDSAVHVSEEGNSSAVA